MDEKQNNMTQEEFTKKHWKQGHINDFEKDLAEKVLLYADAVT